MRSSIQTLAGRNLTLWRALLPGDAFQALTVPERGSVRLWWGEGTVVDVRPGDKVVRMPTPWGWMMDGVYPGAEDDSATHTNKTEAG